VARDPFGLCWRTGYYTPADAIQGCDLPLCTSKEKLEGGKCVPIDPVCVAPQVLDAVKHVCYTPEIVCQAPQVKKDGVCVTLPPVCVAPQTLVDGKCVEPQSKKVSFAADALFDFDKAVLKPEGMAKLDDMAGKLKAINLEVIIAVGHTDSVGTDAYNQKLSIKRAEAVKAFLMSKGVEANRIYTEGKGEKQPVQDNKSAAGRAANRRVEIEVVGTTK
jgi:OOP family OmpA-OmpF porin